MLSEILKNSSNLPGFNLPPELLVGIETADAATVYLLNDEQALIATTGFFMPIVDDPYDFDRIAATNAISDVYAMGGTPIMAFGLVGMPINVLPLGTIGVILRDGQGVHALTNITGFGLARPRPGAGGRTGPNAYCHPLNCQASAFIRPDAPDAWLTFVEHCGEM